MFFFTHLSFLHIHNKIKKKSWTSSPIYTRIERNNLHLIENLIWSFFAIAHTNIQKRNNRKCMQTHRNSPWAYFTRSTSSLIDLVSSLASSSFFFSADNIMWKNLLVYNMSNSCFRKKYNNKECHVWDVHGSHRICVLSRKAFDRCSQHTPNIFMKINSSWVYLDTKKSFTQKKKKNRKENVHSEKINTFYAFNSKN